MRRARPNIAANVALALLIAAFGIVMLVVAARREADRDALASRGERVTARIMAVHHRSAKYGSTTTYDLFFLDERLTSRHATIEAAPGHDVSDDARTMRVVYDPRRASRVRDAHGALRHPWHDVAVGVASLLLAAGLGIRLILVRR